MVAVQRRLVLAASARLHVQNRLSPDAAVTQIVHHDGAQAPRIELLTWAAAR